MSMKWKINDNDTIPILYLYSNNLVFDVGVQLQDICFPRP